VRAILGVLVLSLLAGCSAVRLAYDNADLYLRWRIGSYLDVVGAESDELDERIDAFLDWHRVQALPKYARLADDAARRIARGLVRQDLVWAYDSYLAQARESLHAGTERLAPLLDRLTPEQLRYMERGIAEDNRKFAREYLRGGEHERRARRAARLVERVEDWVGKLSKAQGDRIGQFSERAPLVAEMRERDRRRLQADVMAILEEHQAKERLAERISQWQVGRDPAFTAANEVVLKEFFAMVLDLERSLTPDQRARATGQLRRYARDMRVLAARASRNP
jgi:Family of unknown function (DUF6279)